MTIDWNELDQPRAAGTLTAIYINKAQQMGIDREIAFIHLVGSLAVRLPAKMFDEALAQAYGEIEKNV